MILWKLFTIIYFIQLFILTFYCQSSCLTLVFIQVGVKIFFLKKMKLGLNRTSCLEKYFVFKFVKVFYPEINNWWSIPNWYDTYYHNGGLNLTVLIKSWWINCFEIHKTWSEHDSLTLKHYLKTHYYFATSLNSLIKGLFNELLKLVYACEPRYCEIFLLSLCLLELFYMLLLD